MTDPSSPAHILHDFPINAPASRVWEAVTTPAGLDAWWTKTSGGAPEVGTTYELNFGEGYSWAARVTVAEPHRAFELEMTSADADWIGTRVGFELSGVGASTQVRFSHRGWPESNQHYRTSCFCWAMYLRVLRRHLEHGEDVPYEERLEV